MNFDKYELIVEYEPDWHNRKGRLVWESPKGRRIYTTGLWGTGWPYAIQTDLNAFLIECEFVLDLRQSTEAEITLRIPEAAAKRIAACPEYRNYLYSQHDPIDPKSGLAPYLYWAKLEVVSEPQVHVSPQLLREIAKNAEQLESTELTITFTRDSLAKAEAAYGPFGPEAQAIIDAAMGVDAPIIVGN